jgi:hypothetical protein
MTIHKHPFAVALMNAASTVEALATESASLSALKAAGIITPLQTEQLGQVNSDLDVFTSQYQEAVPVPVWASPAVAQVFTELNTSAWV